MPRIETEGIPSQKPEISAFYYPRGGSALNFSLYSNGREKLSIRGTLEWGVNGMGVSFEVSNLGTKTAVIPVEMLEEIIRKQQEIKSPTIPLTINLTNAAILGSSSADALKLARSLRKPVEIHYGEEIVIVNPTDTEVTIKGQLEKAKAQRKNR